MLDELDRQLDEGLARYTEAPARLGLEERIVARATTPRRHVWPAVIALGIAALVAMVFVLPRHGHAPVVRPVQVARKDAQLQSAPVPVARVAVPQRRTVRVRHRLPKRSQFPTPLPLSAAEREWIEIGRSRPDVVAFVSRPMKPVEVQPIQLAPLEMGEK